MAERTTPNHAGIDPTFDRVLLLGSCLIRVLMIPARAAPEEQHRLLGLVPHGAEGQLFSGDGSAALLRFDLSSTGGGTIVTSAQVTLWADDFYYGPQGVAKMLIPWDEASTTLISLGPSFWSYPHTAYESVTEVLPPNGEVPSPPTSGSVTFDVTNLAQQWRSGAAPNYGLVIGAYELGYYSDAIFQSREAPSPASACLLRSRE